MADPQDGLEARDEETGSVARSEERRVEDRDYLPVIVKRIDEIRRHPDDILESAIEAGLEQLNRQNFSLLLSAISAGLVLGFTAMSVAVVTVATESIASDMVRRLATAAVYPMGFIVCMMSGAELFTEHTATALYPVLDRRASPRSLIRLWSLILAGNLIGVLFGGVLISLGDPVVGARSGYIEVARHLVGFAPHHVLVSAVLAGWLMALAAWMILATPYGFGQLASIYVITFLIGLGGLHHSIAGSFEMVVGMLLSEQFTFYQATKFVGTAVVGNLIGGSLFVGLLNYGHIRESR